MRVIPKYLGSPLLQGVLNVVARSSEPKMIGVYAGRVVTPMKDTQVIRDFAIC